MARDESVSIAQQSAFHALGLPDADGLERRAGLMARIFAILESGDDTRQAITAAQRMSSGEWQALRADRFGGFAADRLLRVLSNLGQGVELRVRSS